eukprot:s603_g23.t1
MRCSDQFLALTDPSGPIIPSRLSHCSSVGATLRETRFTSAIVTREDDGNHWQPMTHVEPGLSARFCDRLLPGTGTESTPWPLGSANPDQFDTLLSRLDQSVMFCCCATETEEHLGAAGRPSSPSFLPSTFPA